MRTSSRRIAAATRERPSVDVRARYSSIAASRFDASCNSGMLWHAAAHLTPAR